MHRAAVGRVTISCVTNQNPNIVTNVQMLINLTHIGSTKKKKKLQNDNKKLMEAKNRMRKINTNIDAPCVPDELTPER